MVGVGKTVFRSQGFHISPHHQVRYGVTANIAAFHTRQSAAARGSIPRIGVLFFPLLHLILLEALVIRSSTL